jgi:hypothetical protein
MAYYYPPNASGLSYITYPVGPTADGVVVTAAGSTNTKGSYAQIAASASFTSNYVSMFTHGGTATDGLEFLFDLAIGAAASEVVIVANTMVEETGTQDAGKFGIWMIPLAIPSGSRIAARCQCSTASATCRIALTLNGAGAIPGVPSYTSYGVNLSDSGGTAVDPGVTIDTKGAYAQMTASTSAVTQALTLMNTIGGNLVPQLAIWAIDIATGAGGAEVVLIPDLRAGAFGLVPEGGPVSPHTQSFLTYIPASTRIALRASCSINNNPDRIFDAGLLAGTAPAEPQGTVVSNKLSIASLPSVQSY